MSTSPGRAGVVEALGQYIRRYGAARPRVAIDGPTASGKSSLANDVANWLSRHGIPVLLATLDDFKRPWRERHRYDRESPAGYFRNAYDYDAVRELLLEPFTTASPAGCALCSIDPLTQTDHQSERTAVPPDAALLVDGVFAFRPEINHFWDIRLWLHVSPEVAVRRCTDRDRGWAGTDAERLVRERYLPAEQLYETEVEPRAKADWVVDNTNIDAPQLSGSSGLLPPSAGLRPNPTPLGDQGVRGGGLLTARRDGCQTEGRGARLD
jgi:uridine kinase